MSSTLVDRREVIGVCRDALAGLREVLYQCPNHELAELMGELDAVHTLTAAGLVATAGEATQRGVVAESQAANVTQWVAQSAPGLDMGTASRIAKLVAAGRKPHHAPLVEALDAGTLDVVTAACIVTEYDRLRPRFTDEFAPKGLAAMIEIGSAYGPAGVRELRARLIAMYAPQGDFQDEQDQAAAQTQLSSPHQDGDLYRYGLVLDAEGMAVLEAAVGALAAPQPGPDGEPDPRSSGKRRADALVEVCRRATAAGDSVGRGLKAQLFFTMTWSDLQECTGYGTVLGSTAHGATLAPETIRRMSCDSGLIPTLVDGEGNPIHDPQAGLVGALERGLDPDVAKRLGQIDLDEVLAEKRLFRPSQIKALWLRDRHCTFPGCSTPAQWCDAHHLVHWADGGPTTLDNAALLCGRHHTIVHRDHLHGEIADGRVVWDRRPDTYQHRQPHQRRRQNTRRRDTGPPTTRAG